MIDPIRETILTLLKKQQGQTALELRANFDSPKSTVEWKIRNLLEEGLLVAVEGSKRRKLYTVDCYDYKDVIFQALTKRQRQTPRRLSERLEIDQGALTVCIDEMLRTKVLTKNLAGNKRTLLTTEYVKANNIELITDYAYSVKKGKDVMPTPILDGQMLFNRLAFN